MSLHTMVPGPRETNSHSWPSTGNIWGGTPTWHGMDKDQHGQKVGLTFHPELRKQQSPTFSSPEAGFVEHIFSKYGVGGWFQNDWSTVGFMLLWESMSTIKMREGGAQAVLGVMQSSCKYRQSFTHLPISHLVLCGLVPHRPWTGGPGLWFRGWGPLC